jgi:autotransporter-associated beta strand protein
MKYHALSMSRALCGLNAALVFAFSAHGTLAGSATWAANRASGDWNTAANWSPKTVPNGSADIATFGTSSQSGIFLSAPVEVAEMNFLNGSSPYTIEVGPSLTLTLSGVGVLDGSGGSHSVLLTADDVGFVGGLYFRNGAGAGAYLSYVLAGGRIASGIGTYAEFYDNSNAGLASFDVQGPTGNGTSGASMVFGDNASGGAAMITSHGTALASSIGAQLYFAGNSTAGYATIVNTGAEGAAIKGGSQLLFSEDSSGGSATITAQGAPNTAGGAGTVYFSDNSTAASANLTAEGGPSGGGAGGLVGFLVSSTAEGAVVTAQDGSYQGGAGGNVRFYQDSTGGNARVKAFGNGSVDLSYHNPATMTFGSIEGSGSLHLGGISLELGLNMLSTTFSGVISDGGNEGGTGGTLLMEGFGTLTLSGANTYTGGTAIDNGVLLVTTKNASATGTGDVSVNQGTLGGTSRLTGAITVGAGGGAAYLAPGVNGIGALSTQKTLTFSANSFYLCEVDTKRNRADSVTARGVTIEGDATFSLIPVGHGTLPVGTSFTVIKNNSRKAINGRFSNLADGDSVSVGPNTLRASYGGGDGNDLTLTVQ